jgi:hypothetical protein
MSGLILHCTRHDGSQIDRVDGIDRSALVSFFVIPVQGRMLVKEFLLVGRLEIGHGQLDQAETMIT